MNRITSQFAFTGNLESAVLQEWIGQPPHLPSRTFVNGSRFYLLVCSPQRLNPAH